MAEIKGADPVAPPPPSRAYTNYVLGILLAVSTLNYLDRQIISVLVEPIKHDLKLTDSQLGLITGLSFAIFYSVLGIPVARLADRRSRPWIIAVSLGVWSAFTMVCGFAQSFVHLLLARIGVGGGEAGGTPPAHSLITDLTTAKNRASALAVFSLGNPIGALIGLAAGGLIGEALGWRTAFILAGAPGLILAVLIVATIKEPRDALAKLEPLRPVMSFGDAFKEIRAKPSFWWICAAGSASGIVVYGQSAFYSSFFLRQHGAELAAMTSAIGPLGLTGLIMGIVRGIGGVAGTMAGGKVTDRMIAKDQRHYFTVPAIAMYLGGPAYVLVLIAPNVPLATVALLLPAFFSGVIFGPTFAAVQTMMSPRARATAAAVLLFILNIIGLGLGPLTVGLLSDAYGAHMGSVEGLKWAMLTVSPLMLVAGFCFWQGRRSIRQDLVQADI